VTEAQAYGLPKLLTGIIFQGTPTQCMACHADPVYHQGLFGTACASCHTTSVWTPAKFNGAHAFPVSHGGANNGGANTCRNCHLSNLNSYTCYSCHPQAQIASSHQGIANLNDCVRCHPTGGGGG
jgi:hypothetical protein